MTIGDRVLTIWDSPCDQASYPGIILLLVGEDKSSKNGVRSGHRRGRKRRRENPRTSRGIEVQIQIDAKLQDAPQQSVLQHTSQVVIDTKDANTYVHLIATLPECLQEIAMLPQLGHERFEMGIHGRRCIY